VRLRLPPYSASEKLNCFIRTVSVGSQL